MDILRFDFPGEVLLLWAAVHGHPCLKWVSVFSFVVEVEGLVWVAVWVIVVGLVVSVGLEWVALASLVCLAMVEFDWK